MKELATVEKLPDVEIYRVVIEDPIQQLLVEGAKIAQTLGTNSENVSACANLQIMMAEGIDGLSQKQFVQAKKLAQALQTWNLWEDPECTIPMALNEAPLQYQAFGQCSLEKKRRRVIDKEMASQSQTTLKVEEVIKEVQQS